MERRAEPSPTFRRAIQRAPDDVKQTIANLIAMLLQDPPPDSLPIVQFLASRGFGLKMPSAIACLGDVMIVFAAPADHPIVLLLDVLWLT